MNKELIAALDVLEKEKGISKESLFEAIESNLVVAYKNNFNKADNVSVTMDRETGEFHIYSQKTVVEEVTDKVSQISLEDARKIKASYDLGDTVNVEIQSKDFGRIATQSAKNGILQKIREEERKSLYEQYYEKQNDVITGVVQRINGKNISINLGKVDTILTEKEQSKGEFFRPNDRIKLYVTEDLELLFQEHILILLKDYLNRKSLKFRMEQWKLRALPEKQVQEQKLPYGQMMKMLMQ